MAGSSGAEGVVCISLLTRQVDGQDLRIADAVRLAIGIHGISQGDVVTCLQLSVVDDAEGSVVVSILAVERVLLVVGVEFENRNPVISVPQGSARGPVVTSSSFYHSLYL